MKSKDKNLFVTVSKLTLCAAIFVSLVDVVHAEVRNTNSNLYGNTWGEWSARWAQWMLSIPKSTNPTLDPTGEFCGVGQSGPVWFLAGTSGGTANRKCSIPAGKALFFPIANGMFGAAAFDCEPTVPGTLCNMNAIRKAAAEATDNVLLAATVDGRKLANLYGLRVTSPEYTVTYPSDNVVDVAPGSYAPNVADGYYVMLKPLSPGVHTVSFNWRFVGGPFAGTSGGANYNLIVNK